MNVASYKHETSNTKKKDIFVNEVIHTNDIIHMNDVIHTNDNIHMNAVVPPFEIEQAHTSASSDTTTNQSDKKRCFNWRLYNRLFLVICSLYAFLFGLDLMGTSFKALSGKNIGSLFNYVSNPVASVIIGILVTVVLQSSSTTTSIIVTMVGAGIISPKMAIPLVMGANIGTSITNTLVSHGHIQNRSEFKRAFAGATIHDIFNLMTVVILLPIEVISDAFGWPFLYEISNKITNTFINVEGVTFKSPLKVIVSPVVDSLIKVDKNIIKANAEGCVNCNTTSNDMQYCWNVGQTTCLTQDNWNEKYVDANIIKSGVFSSLNDGLGGGISLCISLIVLCISLYLIIKTLKKMVLKGRQSRFMKCLHKIITKNGYISILFGMLLTISVQSSSITTSVLTPLVGLSIISLEQMLPLTLGANLGTTCTALLASFVTESKGAVQVAICHFCFNSIGILIIYPFPCIRKYPLIIARRFGRLSITYKWFSIFYISYLFVILPLLFLGISLLFNINIFGVIFGCILSIATLCWTGLLFKNFEKVVGCIKRC